MNPINLTTAETNMIELLRVEPALAEKRAEVLAVVAAGAAGNETIDAAEARLVDPVRALGRHALGGGARRAEQAAGERVCAAHRYLANRRDQLDYAAALARGLPVGSGLIESGHKHFLQKRLRIPGGAWLRSHCAALVRVVRANGGWAAYWASLSPARN